MTGSDYILISGFMLGSFALGFVMGWVSLRDRLITDPAVVRGYLKKAEAYEAYQKALAE
jgi:hypothetical protein